MSHRADEFEVAGWYEAVRRRPLMYLGDLGSLGLARLIRDLADVALSPKRILIESAKSVVTIRAACTPPSVLPRSSARAPYLVEVCNSLAISLDDPPTVSGAEVIDSTCTPARFERINMAPSSLAIANALSRRFVLASISRDVWTQVEFERGHIIRPPASSVSPSADGLFISFEPDEEVFSITSPPFQLLAEVARELGLVRGIPVAVRDLASGAAYGAFEAV